MQAFAAHPYQTSQMQTAIGLCLATSDEAALRAYIDAIYIQSSWLGRDEVKACLGAFANSVSLRRRQAAWRLAFARWSDWNFGERDGHTTPTEISLSNMDFAIVGYAVECLTPEERETHIAGCLDMIGRAEHVWHRSQLKHMHYIYRALCRFQPFAHARDCGADRDNVIAHPGFANASRAVCDDSTKRMVLRTEALLALVVLTTERKAA